MLGNVGKDIGHFNVVTQCAGLLGEVPGMCLLCSCLLIRAPSQAGSRGWCGSVLTPLSPAQFLPWAMVSDHAPLIFLPNAFPWLHEIKSLQHCLLPQECGYHEGVDLVCDWFLVGRRRKDTRRSLFSAQCS